MSLKTINELAQKITAIPSENPEEFCIQCKDATKFLPKDIFETPLEFVQQLLVYPRPTDYFHRTVHEHGYTWGVIQDNYVDAKKITMEECANITESISLADVYDTVIYNEGAWDTLMPYFIESACIRPCMTLKGRINTQRLRPEIGRAHV